MIRARSYTSLGFGLVVWALLGGSLLTVTSWWLDQDYLFAYHSKSMVGTVERKYSKVTRSRQGNSETYYLDYRYRVGDISAAGRSFVTRDTYLSVSADDPLPILYLTERIGKNRIDLPPEQRQVRGITYALVTATLLTLVGGGLVLRHYVRQNKIYRFLRTSGASCQGTVAEVKCNLVGKAQTKQHYLTFTFRDSQGRERLGATGYLNAGDEYPWHEGRPIRVYFDPDNSKHFTVSLNSGRTNS
jgi:hypothetical protein